MAYKRRTLEMQADQIEAVLARHKVTGRVQGGVVTPRFVRFQVGTDTSARISKVTGLADEIALALDKHEARVYREGGSIQIEVPRSQHEPVRLLPLCGRLEQVPAITAVLGLEQTGVPLLLLERQVPATTQALQASSDTTILVQLGDPTLPGASCSSFSAYATCSSA